MAGLLTLTYIGSVATEQELVNLQNPSHTRCRFVVMHTLSPLYLQCDDNRQDRHPNNRQPKADAIKQVAALTDAIVTAGVTTAQLMFKPFPSLRTVAIVRERERLSPRSGLLDGMLLCIVSLCKRSAMRAARQRIGDP